jgi:hypothetical protein
MSDPANGQMNKEDTEILNTTAHVFIEQGIMLKSSGLISFTSNDLISVFRKVKLPLLKPVINCNQRWIDDFNRKIERTTQEHIDLFTHISQPSRQKRSLALLSLGVCAIDLLLAGIGYGKLSHQLKELSSRFQTFAEQQHDFNKNQVEFDKKLVALVATGE